MLQVIIDRLETQYYLHSLSRWSLEHRLFRETSRQGSTEASFDGESPKTHEPRYLQVLHLSHHPDCSYLAVTRGHSSSEIAAGTPAASNSKIENDREHAAIIAIPSGNQTEEFVQLMLSRFSPLWTQRQVLQVVSGQAFEAGDFRVKVGELRQGQGGSQQSRGVVAELEWISGDESDWSSAEAIIVGFWEGLDVKGAKGYIRSPGVGSGFNTVKQWCEALRIR